MSENKNKLCSKWIFHSAMSPTKRFQKQKKCFLYPQRFWIVQNGFTLPNFQSKFITGRFKQFDWRTRLPKVRELDVVLVSRRISVAFGNRIPKFPARICIYLIISFACVPYASYNNYYIFFFFLSFPPPLVIRDVARYYTTGAAWYPPNWSVSFWRENPKDTYRFSSTPRPAQLFSELSIPSMISRTFAKNTNCGSTSTLLGAEDYYCPGSTDIPVWTASNGKWTFY